MSTIDASPEPAKPAPKRKPDPAESIARGFVGDGPVTGNAKRRAQRAIAQLRDDGFKIVRQDWRRDSI